MMTLIEYGRELNGLAAEMNKDTDRFFGGGEVLGAYSFYQQLKATEEYKAKMEEAEKGEETGYEELPF